MINIARNEEHDNTGLEKLGLIEQPLREAVKEGYLARTLCTDNDPPATPPYIQWSRTVRALRENLLPLGWTKTDEKNYSLVLDPTGAFAIAVATGDENTGRENGGMPTTKCPKGPNTADAIHENIIQLKLDLGLIQEIKAACKLGRATWMLMFYQTETEIRAELSLPTSIGSDGHIDAWHERIILESIPIDASLYTTTEPDFGPDFDIDIQRKP